MLIFAFLDTDLHNVVKRGSILKDIHKRYIMYQLFKGMHYMHSGNVIHRDQKVCILCYIILPAGVLLLESPPTVKNNHGAFEETNIAFFSFLFFYQ